MVILLVPWIHVPKSVHHQRIKDVCRGLTQTSKCLYRTVVNNKPLQLLPSEISKGLLGQI